MKWYTKNKYEITKTEATLIDKRKGDYFSIPGSMPSPQTLCELEFKTVEKTLTFEVGEFEYNVVDIGMSGELVYQGYELIRFGSWIKKIENN